MATFTTPDMNALPDDFAAIIDHGDGSTDTGAITIIQDADLEHDPDDWPH